MIKLPDEKEMKWRDLALQFDAHRMHAISLLKMIIKDVPDDQYLLARNFIESAPLPAEEVLRNRIAEIAEAQRLNATAQPDDGNDGYVKAFYEIASILGISAQPSSPKHVFETVMKPKLQGLVATAQHVSDGWAKCCDRMPDNEDYYLTYSNSGVDVAYFDGRVFSDKKSTHWMPLPAAPGGQDD